MTLSDAAVWCVLSFIAGSVLMAALWFWFLCGQFFQSRRQARELAELNAKFVPGTRANWLQRSRFNNNDTHAVLAIVLGPAAVNPYGKFVVPVTVASGYRCGQIHSAFASDLLVHAIGPEELSDPTQERVADLIHRIDIARADIASLGPHGVKSLEATKENQ